MNKQQLIRVLKEQLDLKGNYNDYPLDSKERINAVGNFEGITLALSLLNQLEEPEQEKVMIPQFVADFITEIKPNFNIRTVFTLKNNKHEQGQEWALDNPDVFARAWLDGYSVEKEKLYRVVLNHKQIMWQATDGSGDVDIISRDRITTGKTKFTEQEIKNIDERFWVFAEEITK